MKKLSIMVLVSLTLLVHSAFAHEDRYSGEIEFSSNELIVRMSVYSSTSERIVSDLKWIESASFVLNTEGNPYFYVESVPEDARYFEYIPVGWQSQSQRWVIMRDVSTDLPSIIYDADHHAYGLFPDWDCDKFIPCIAQRDNWKK